MGKCVNANSDLSGVKGPSRGTRARQPVQKPSELDWGKVEMKAPIIAMMRAL